MSDIGIVFASEIKSILASKEVDKDLNLSAVDDYLSFMYIPGPQTIYKNIDELLPGHYLIYENARADIIQYWDVDYGMALGRRLQRKREQEYAEELAALLQDAVRISLLSEVPLGVFLSGGIDSSSIAGLMSRASPGRVKTFSIRGGHGAFDELPYARLVAKQYGTDHHEFEVEEEKVENLLPKLVDHLDQPFADSSIVPTYYVAKLARPYATVALSGEGGDELFGGYDQHKKMVIIANYKQRIPSWLRKKMTTLASWLGKKNNLVRKFDTLNNYSLFPLDLVYSQLRSLCPDLVKKEFYSAKLMDVFCEKKNNSLINFFSKNNVGDINPLELALYADLKTYLNGDLLTKVDRMSMASSLEVRVPFLDHRVIEFAATIPSNLKIKNGVSKYILRKAMAGVLPQVIGNRRDKRGFSVPVDHWFRGDLAKFALDILTDGNRCTKNFFTDSGLIKLMDDHRSGRMNYGSLIWALVVLEIWMKRRLP